MVDRHPMIRMAALTILPLFIMKNQPLSRILYALVFLASSIAASAQGVGLVLSGGGAKGIAHVAIIKVLEDNDIPIDYVTGTSMGAIVGSLYACGYSPEEMMELFTSKDFAQWSTGTLDPKRIYYTYRQPQTPRQFNVNFSKPDSANIFSYIPANLISPMPMNVEFLRLFGPYTLQCEGDFDKLFVPFRCVTSDIYHKHKIVCANGSLGEAVRQSMSFPLVFKPIERDGVLVYDGGIYDNFPVDVMTDTYHPSFIIGSNVSSPNKKPQPDNVYSQLEDMIIQNNDYSLPDSLGVKIDIPVLNFGVLDFGKAREIYDIGYKTGLAMVDSIKSRCAERRPASLVAERRRNFRDNTPPLLFDSVSTVGVPKEVASYIDYLFAGKTPRSIDVSQVDDAYYRIVSTGLVSDLEPQMRWVDGKNVLIVKPSLNDKWNCAIGGWLTSNNNNLIYLSGSYSSLTYRSFSVDLDAWIGQSYLAAMLDAKWRFNRGVPLYLRFRAVASRTRYYNDHRYFFRFSDPSFISSDDDYFTLSIFRNVNRTLRISASLGYQYRRDKYDLESLKNSENILTERNRQNRAALGAVLESNNLNHPIYPSQGHLTKISVYETFSHDRFPGLSSSSRFRTLLHAQWQAYFPLLPRLTLGSCLSGAAMFGPLENNFTAVLLNSRPYNPVPNLINFFNPAMRAPQYLTVGLIPIWSPFKNFQTRLDAHAFLHVRGIRKVGVSGVEYGKWFNRVEGMAQLSAVYNLPHVSVSLYGVYLTGIRNNWNFGINLGLLIPAPGFL